MSLISTDLRPVGYDWVLYSRYTELYRNYTAVWKRFRILITENSFFRKQSFLGHWNWSVYVSRPVDVRLGVISGRNDFQILTSENCVLRKLIFFPTLIYIRDIEPMQNIFQINIFKNQLFWQWSLAAKLDWHGCQDTQGLILGARTLKNQYHDFRKFFNRIRL